MPRQLIVPRAERRARSGYCSWLEDGEYCETFGPLVKGLCRRHYDVLGDRMRQRGLIRGVDIRPLRCVCATPKPQPVRIISGTLLIADAFECQICGRAVL